MSGSILLILRLILTIGLYAFLGWIVWLLWRDLSRQTNLLISHQPSLLTLERDLEGDPQPIRFRAAEIIVGRDPACDYTISDSTVSARHTRLAFRSGHWWVEDLHSTNGTFLNQVPVNEPVIVTNGDYMRCGQITFKLTVGVIQDDSDLD